MEQISERRVTVSCDQLIFASENHANFAKNDLSAQINPIYLHTSVWSKFFRTPCIHIDINDSHKSRQIKFTIHRARAIPNTPRCKLFRVCARAIRCAARNCECRFQAVRNTRAQKRQNVFRSGLFCPRCCLDLFVDCNFYEHLREKQSVVAEIAT